MVMKALIVLKACDISTKENVALKIYDCFCKNVGGR